MEELPEMTMYSQFLLATEAPIDPIDLYLPFQIPDQYTHFNQASFQEVAPVQIHGGEKSINSTPQPTQGNGSKKYESKMKETKKDINQSKVVFRTKTNDEVLDDGYKWRKYGKKSIKNSPHPRNYYKCSSNGCGVKKRVERDPEDSSFTFTTYEGVHNHMSPGAIRSQNVTCPGRNLS